MTIREMPKDIGQRAVHVDAHNWLLRSTSQTNALLPVMEGEHHHSAIDAPRTRHMLRTGQRRRIW